MKIKIIFLLLAYAGVARAQFNPVALTPGSYTQDIVVSSNTVPPVPQCINFYVGKGTNTTDNTLYEQGLAARPGYAGYNSGVPAHGSVFTNINNANQTFLMPPSYTANNVLAIVNNSSEGVVATGSFILATPTTAASLAVLATGGNGGCTVGYTVTHQDNSTETGSLSVPDWFSGGSAVAWGCNGRINVSGTYNNYNSSSANNNAPYLYSETLAVSSGSPVTKITFNYTSGSGLDNFFAVSASTDATVYTPVAVTGFNEMAIVPAAIPFPVTATMDNGTNVGSTEISGQNPGATWMEAGFDRSNPSYGLPPSGSTFTSQSQPTHHYQMGNYATNNAVLIDGGHWSANIVPAAPTAASALAFLTAGGHISSGIMTNICIIQHADGVSETNLFLAYDWFTSNSPAWSTKGRVSLNSRTLDEHAATGQPYLSESYFSINDTVSPVTNILVQYGTAPATNATTYVLAVSASAGSVAPVITSGPTPASQSWHVTESASIAVTAVGTAPMTNSWLMESNGVYVPLTDGVNARGSVITGSASTTLTFSGLTLADGTNYELRVANVAGCVTSSVASLIVYPTNGNVINFDVPGSDLAGASVGGAKPPYVNYSGQAALADAGNGYWNAVVQNDTTAAGYSSDNLTTSPITFTCGAYAAYDGKGQGAMSTPTGLEAFYLYAPAGQSEACSLNNVPPGIYNLYLYGKNGGWASDGTTFTAWSDETASTSLSTVNSSTSSFVNGNDYVEFTSIVVGAGGQIFFTYQANTGAGKTEGAFNGVQLQLVQAGLPAGATLTWNGTPSGSWDIAGNPNWQTGEYYTENAGVGPAVAFDDSASGATAVTLNTAVSPASVTVNNSALTYSFGGAGHIAGGGGLLKEGPGALTLATANTYTNTTIIVAGTLQLGDGTSVNGSVAGGIVDNSALVVANPASQTLANVVSGSGSLAKTGAGVLTLTANNSLFGAVAVNSGTLVLNAGGVAGSVPVLGSAATVNVASGAALALTGTNSLGYATNTSFASVVLADNAALSVAGGQHTIGGLSLGSTPALTGSGLIALNGALTNNYGAEFDCGLTLGGYGIFLNTASALTFNRELDLLAATSASANTIIAGAGGGSQGVLTTHGSMAMNHYVELDYVVWNADLGTNVLAFSGNGGDGSGAKLTLGKQAFMPVQVNWFSGTCNYTPSDFFVMSDGSPYASSELDITGGSVNINNNNSRCLIGNAGTAVINVSGGSLVFNGTNTVVEVGGDVSYAQSGASGTLTVTNNGSVLVGPASGGLELAPDSGGLNVTGTLNLGGGVLTTWPGITSGSTGGGMAYFNFNGGTLRAGTNNAAFLQGLTAATVLPGGAMIDDGGNRITIGQSLLAGGNDGGLVKLGAGTMILTNASSYTGPTVISNGTLQVDGSLAAGSTVTVCGGATLAGSGTENDSVNVQAGGALRPGSGGAAGTNSIGGNLALAAGATAVFGLGAASDALAVNGNVTLGGTLAVTNLGGLAAGTFTVITYGGTLSGGVPALVLPAGVLGSIDTSSSGQVNVVITAVTQTSPAIASVSAEAGNLVIAGTNGVPNGSYYVLTSTNVALPASQWQPVATNQFDASGAFAWTNAIGNGPQSYFRLKLP